MSKSAFCQSYPRWWLLKTSCFWLRRLNELTILKSNSDKRLQQYTYIGVVCRVFKTAALNSYTPLIWQLLRGAHLFLPHSMCRPNCKGKRVFVTKPIVPLLRGCRLNLSERLPIEYSVVQRSTLSSILFLIYKNNISNLRLNGKLFLSADGTLVTLDGRDWLSTGEEARLDLTTLQQWLDLNIVSLLFQNKIHPNLNKIQ